MAKIYLWDALKKISKENKASIILTTHSMREAENLCDKIGILINGRFVCVDGV
jgi:ABC-type multidrug transport system ATPase subunit